MHSYPVSLWELSQHNQNRKDQITAPLHRPKPNFITAFEHTHKSTTKDLHPCIAMCLPSIFKQINHII